MSIDEAKVRELAARVEDHRLDFKEDLYSSNEELAKDLMAFANLLPPGSTGHILLGVRQRQDDTGEIVGVNLGVDRDSNYQQKADGKLNRTPRFTFFRLHLQEGEIGVFEINGTGERPYFPIANAGKLRKNIPLKRLGSSTADATPDEVKDWVHEDQPDKESAVVLDRLPKDEREKILIVADMLTASFRVVPVARPFAATLLEVDHSSAAAKFHLVVQDRDIVIPLRAISHIWRGGPDWRVVVEGYLRSAEGWEYQPRWRAQI